MEALGGDRKWIDRFMAGHSAIIYYWVLILMWLISPTLAYNFSELIEAHAVDTYGQFVDENEERLKALPAPLIARRYYTQDLYLCVAPPGARSLLGGACADARRRAAAMMSSRPRARRGRGGRWVRRCTTCFRRSATTRRSTSTP